MKGSTLSSLLVVVVVDNLGSLGKAGNSRCRLLLWLVWVLPRSRKRFASIPWTALTQSDAHAATICYYLSTGAILGPLRPSARARVG